MYPYSGKTFDLWPNGDLKVRGRLRDGLMNGKWEYYHTNGSKMAVGKYFDGDGSDIDPETKIPRKGFVGNWTFYYKSRLVIECPITDKSLSWNLGFRVYV